MEGQVMKETIRNKNTIYGGNNQNKLEERIEEDWIAGYCPIYKWAIT